MVLSFKAPFKEPIIKGIKTHTIREDKNNRWKAGNKIHFATGVRTKNYKQFKDGKCLSVQKIIIEHFKNSVQIDVDGKWLNVEEKEMLARNDGFESFAEFLKWFDKDFRGKLIHWTEYKY